MFLYCFAVILKWFVNGEVALLAMKDPKHLIQEESVEVRPEKLPDSVVDENVDVHLVRKYFTSDAWLLVKDVITQKQTNQVFVCNSCSHDLDESPSILCDHCLLWFHITCVGLKQSPKARYWFCRQCHLSF